MTDCSLDTIPRHDYLRKEELVVNQALVFTKNETNEKTPVTFPYETHHVLLVAGPFLENLQRLTGVEHTGRGKHHLRA